MAEEEKKDVNTHFSLEVMENEAPPPTLEEIVSASWDSQASNFFGKNTEGNKLLDANCSEFLYDTPSVINENDVQEEVEDQPNLCELCNRDVPIYFYKQDELI